MWITKPIYDSSVGLSKLKVMISIVACRLVYIENLYWKLVRLLRICSVILYLKVMISIVAWLA